MPNFEHYKKRRLLFATLFLGLLSQSALADKVSQKIQKTDNQPKNNQVKTTIKIDEEFLIFLAEVDSQQGVEIDPLDMLDLELDENSDVKTMTPENLKMKQSKYSEKPEENK